MANPATDLAVDPSRNAIAAMGAGGDAARQLGVSTAPIVDPRDFSSRYSTSLSPDDEAKYQQWVAGQSQVVGRDVNKDNYDYDLRGAWAGGAGASANGHFPDTFKKPNHPTFSDQSRYHGVGGNVGGVWGGGEEGRPWTFTPGSGNMFSPKELQEYFRRAEPGSQLVAPSPPPVAGGG